MPGLHVLSRLNHALADNAAERGIQVPVLKVFPRDSLHGTGLFQFALHLYPFHIRQALILVQGSHAGIGILRLSQGSGRGILGVFQRRLV